MSDRRGTRKMLARHLFEASEAIWGGFSRVFSDCVCLAQFMPGRLFVVGRSVGFRRSNIEHDTSFGQPRAWPRLLRCDAPPTRQRPQPNRVRRVGPTRMPSAAIGAAVLPILAAAWHSHHLATSFQANRHCLQFRGGIEAGRRTTIMPRIRLTIRHNPNDPADDLRYAARVRRDLWAHSPVEIDPDSRVHGTHRDAGRNAYFEFATEMPRRSRSCPSRIRPQ